MNGNNSSRVPLHIQFPALIKATGQQVNPSYDTFKHQEHASKYKTQGEDRPNTHAMSVIRRNVDGTLDYEWACNMILDAVHNANYQGGILPIHLALLTVVFPQRYRAMEPMQAEILTQFSASEKQKVKELVEARLKAEENWNAGRGGGSVEGRNVEYTGK